MEDSPTSSLLVCQESISSLEEDEYDYQFDSILSYNDDDDDEYIRSLLDRETFSNAVQTRQFLENSCGGEDWIPGARLKGVEYILQKRKLLGFKSHTAYLAVTFLDRFLPKRSLIDLKRPWGMRLLSIACLSLAAKMEECVLPVLSEYCDDEYSFRNEVIQRIEILVLQTLDWKLGSISPFAYTRFFVRKLRNEDDPVLPRNVFSTIADFLLNAAKDVQMMSFRPSVIAAAATLVVLDHRLSRSALELKLAPLASTLALEIEDLISCYRKFQQMNSGIKSPDLSPIQLQRTEETSTSVGSSKRKRRLDFDDEGGDGKGMKKHLSFR